MDQDVAVSQGVELGMVQQANTTAEAAAPAT
jgi:hypothetical protein